MSAALKARKRALRERAKQRRAQLVAALGEAGARQAGVALSARLLTSVPVPAAAVVSAYWPMGSEIDPRPAMERLHGAGHPIGLPVVVAPGQALVFRAWRPGDVLEPAGFGTRVPGAGRPEVRPQVLLVPLLAFDRAGYRLGYGGGFYDRTLARLRAAGGALAVGVAFAGQEVDSVPRDDSDARLDWILTEDEAIEVR